MSVLGTLLAGGSRNYRLNHFLHPEYNKFPFPISRIPLANIPLCHASIQLFKTAGIKEIMVNTLASVARPLVTYFNDEYQRQQGVKIHWKHEPGIKGSAISVRDTVLESNLKEDDIVVVVYGDIITKFDIQQMIEQHKRENALVSIALTTVPFSEVHNYGTVVPRGLDRSIYRGTEDADFIKFVANYYVPDVAGRAVPIESFHEKLDVSKAPSNLINSGIYVIQAELFYMWEKGKFGEEMKDFGADIFPAMIEDKELKERLFGYVMAPDLFWGTVNEPRDVWLLNMEVLLGKTGLKIPGKKDDKENIYIDSNVDIGSGVTIKPPVAICNNVVVEKGATIGPCAILGSFSRVKRSATIKNSILLSPFYYFDKIPDRDRTIGSYTSVDRCLITGGIIPDHSGLNNLVWVESPQDGFNTIGMNLLQQPGDVSSEEFIRLMRKDILGREE